MSDEPTSNDQMYHQWIASRRTAMPPRDLVDRVIVAIEKRDPPSNYVHFVDGPNPSPLVRCAACFAALLVGSLPFLFVAYVAQSLVF